jgi:hypothetical protein
VGGLPGLVHQEGELLLKLMDKCIDIDRMNWMREKVKMCPDR